VARRSVPEAARPVGIDEAYSVAVSPGGRAYVAGQTDPGDFPSRDGDHGDNPYADAFVTRLAADGKSLVDSTSLGGSAGDSTAAVALAPGGDVAGNATSNDFPTARGALQTTDGMGLRFQGFVTRRNTAGDALIHSTSFGNASSVVEVSTVSLKSVAQSVEEASVCVVACGRVGPARCA
jgi:hypothetical protein